MSFKWGAHLELGSHEVLEDRIKLIVEYMAKHYPNAVWQVSDIDATGKLGSSMTTRINIAQELEIQNVDLLNVLSEEGQILEFGAVLVSENYEALTQIVVRDGISVDVLGDRAILPANILGNHRPADMNLFAK